MTLTLSCSRCGENLGDGTINNGALIINLCNVDIEETQKQQGETDVVNNEWVSKVLAAKNRTNEKEEKAYE